MVRLLSAMELVPEDSVKSLKISDVGLDVEQGAFDSRLPDSSASHSQTATRTL